ncbi:hypothetical protein [Rhizobacter sp. SG703]|uniref:hypothetical protein n=1 Tax=Rhizobacter sp. SG703 TaxID=2587140 RepID=UPI001447C1EE|nr:hypothetical protein [Rhizobacter sp. SG703]
MNPLNVLPELLRIYELGKPDERKAVRNEAHRILSNDPVLHSPPFEAVTKRVLKLTDDKGLLATSKEEGRGISLLGYFVAELVAQLNEQYIPAAINALAARLQEPDPTAGESLDSAFSELHVMCCNLLSSLIYKRVSLESLYSLYSEVLVPRAPKAGYQFQNRYGLLTALLTQVAVEHHIVLALDNVTQPASFPASIGGFEFGVVPPFLANAANTNHRGQLAMRYLSQAKRRLFASITVKAQDPRAAGAEAAEKLNDILNLVRFEYERERVTMPDAFAFRIPTKPARDPRVYSLPAVVPNPSTAMDVDGLASFVKSVDELVLHGARFSAEGRDRVMSAFRLYRTGLDTPVLENKLVNWWTALEYLVRGTANQSGGIGKSVEDHLAPVLCRSYIAKHLLAYRAALIEAGAMVTETDGSPIELKALSLDKLLLQLQKPHVQSQLLAAVSGQEFCTWHLSQFFAAIADAKKLHARNAAHEQKLRWQLQRLWRARCDIVHSAERSASAALLCANLEYYLKTALMALLKALRDSPTLSGPKEFFDRQTLAYEGMQLDLQAGSYRELLVELSA